MKNGIRLMLCLLFAAGAQGARADEGGANIAAGPVSAEILFVPDYYSFITRIDDAILQKVGCHYMATTAADVSRLLGAVQQARNDHPVDPVSSAKREVRNKIIFHLADGSSFFVSYSQRFTNLAQLTGSWNGEPAYFQNELVTQVRAIVGDAGLKQSNDKMRQSCGAPRTG